MKKTLIVTLSVLIMTMFLLSCDNMPSALGVEVERINAESKVDIEAEKTKQEAEKTKQLELELKILKEQNK